jgi:hypothetical protein
MERPKGLELRSWRTSSGKLKRVIACFPTNRKLPWRIVSQKLTVVNLGYRPLGHIVLINMPARKAVNRSSIRKGQLAICLTRGNMRTQPNTRTEEKDQQLAAQANAADDEVFANFCQRIRVADIR